MKSLLIVDDEQPFLLSLKDGLNSHDPELVIQTAADGQQAVELLARKHVDLLITDLKLPIMDGFQLLAHVSRHYPELPAVVMTAFGTPEIEARVAEHNTLHYLEKPLDFEILVETIDKVFSGGEQSFIKGITLATFLQLVQMEKKSCTLKIHSGPQVGYLFILAGELIDAACEGLQGEAAALAVVTWENAEIEMDGVCRRKEKRISASMDFILMEGFRLKDEADHAEEIGEPNGMEINRSEPSQVADKESSAEDLALAETLANSRLISEWAIYDPQNFLLHHSAPPCSLEPFEPSQFLEMSRQMTSFISCGQLRFIQFQAAQGRRALLLQHQQRTLAVVLKNGSKPNQFIEELSSLQF